MTDMNDVDEIEYICENDICCHKNWKLIKTGNTTRKVLHSVDDEPSCREKDGALYWYKDGLPRDEGDQPAYIGADGTRSWYKKGLCHRDGDEPAIICANGTKQWYKDGFLHRDGDQPAYICGKGSQMWYKCGKLHRDGDKPAIILDNPRCYFYYKDGTFYRQKKWINGDYFLDGKLIKSPKSCIIL